MSTETVAYTEGPDRFDAVVARPSAPGPHPAVMIFHAWGGRSPFEEDKARALAELGYVGVAVDLYGVGRRGASTEENQALMGELMSDPARFRRRIAASFELARGLEGVDGERVGCIGFCLGGLCALLGARMGLSMRGAVSFHGLLKLGEPLDTTPAARMLVLHGQDDPMVPPSDVGAFAEEMKRVGGDWELHAYPGVVHAFTNPAADDPTLGTKYDAEADRRSWAAMRRFLDATLRA